MTIADARTLEDGRHLMAEVCIVGAGAAGITLALELGAAGRSVLLVESGGFAPDEAVQSLYDLESIGYPPRQNYMSRARYFGGSCNLWAGRCMRLQAQDFAGRAWVPDSAWPIAADEVFRHYPRAAAILGLGDVAQFELATHDRRLSAAERDLLAGADVVPTLSLWAPKPKRFGRGERRRLAQATGIKLLLHASVTRIELDDDGAKVTALCARAAQLETHARPRWTRPRSACCPPVKIPPNASVCLTVVGTAGEHQPRHCS